MSKKPVSSILVFMIYLLAAAPVAATDYQTLRSLIEINDPRKALDLALSIEERYTSDSEFYFLKGRAYQDLKLNLESLEAYSQSIALNRTNYKAYINRGLVKGALGNLRASLIDLKKAVQLNKNAKLAFLNLGVTYAAQNDPKSAITAFDSALIIDPNFLEALRNRGITNHHLGNKTKACLDWRQSIQLKKDEIQNWIDKYCN
jgi:tetratricopeptide (TPR) repeat protein